MTAYVNKTRFYSLLGVCFATGERYTKRGVLKPAAILDGNQPIFEHSAASIAEAHKSIADYRKNLRLTRYNLTSPSTK
jgi:hypothetical protein